MLLSVRRQRQVGANHIRDMNADAVLRRHQPSVRVELPEARCHGQLFSVGVQRRRGAKAKLADPRAENESDKQSCLYRHLAADAPRLPWVIIGLDRADDGERIVAIFVLIFALLHEG